METQSGLYKIALATALAVLVLAVFTAVGSAADEWNRTFGGTENDYVYSGQQTSDGGYVMAGSTYSFGNGERDFWLIKTDSSGNEQWNKTFGGTNEDRCKSVSQTSDGGYILTGYTYSYGAGRYDVWLLKTDSAGNEEWNRTYGWSDQDYGKSVQQTADGGYIIAGNTDIKIGSGINYAAWLIKVNETGYEEWNRTYDLTSKYDAFESVQQTSDGGYIAAGYAWVYHDGKGGYDFWLLKVNDTGVEEWNRTFGGASKDQAYEVRQTPDGGYILTGGTKSFGAGKHDLWLIKTDSNGNEEWNRTYGGAADDYGYSVDITTDGGFVVTGYTRSYSTGSKKDVWLVKKDSEGNEQGHMSFGSKARDDDYGYAVQQLSEYSYMIAGYTKSYGAGGSDAWLIRTQAPPECYPNKVYFVPEDVRVPGYCDTTTVGVWTDTNVSIGSGYIVFEYTQCCADVTNFQFNTTNWQHPECAWFDDPGRVRIKFLNITANGPGPVHLGDLTIHCCNESSYCVTDMVWNVSYPSYLEDDMGNEITPVNWKDGTFRCNIPDLVITSAWGEGNDTHYTVSYTIKNVGKAPASASYANLSVDGSQVETMQVPALGPGEEQTYSFSTVIAITDETDLIKVCADYNDTVVELDETNNCKKQFYPAGVELAIEFSPAHNITVAPGDQFVANVTIDARPGVEVYGVEYDLWFNPTVVHAEWQNEGGFLNKDGNSTNVYNAKIDNSIGKIEFAITRIGTSVGVSGNGTLAKIGFTALEQQGACTNLTFDNVKVSDADADKIEPVDLVNGSVCITANERPVPIGKSLFRYNNVGEKYLSKAYFSGSDSFDPDGSITYYRWAFGDGEYGTGETIDHIYDSWNWNDSTDTYEPFNASLTVEDDGTPILDNTTYFPVNVSIAGDAKPDGIVDIFDAVIVGLEWDKTANFNGSLYWWDNPRGDQADLNNDQVVDIFDAVIVGANWDHTAWR